MSKERALLHALVISYWRGAVTQGEAAKLIGMRKETFAELADGLLLVEAMKRVSWHYYRERFHYTFPECDARAVRKPQLSGKGQGIRRFTDEELLTPPQRVTLNDVVNGNWQTPCLDKMDAGNVIAPRPSFPRAPARVVGRQHFPRAA